MKSQTCFLSGLLLLAATGACGEAFTWELDRSFKTTADRTLEVEARSGNIHVSPGAEDAVILEIRMSTRASSEEKAGKIFDSVELNFSESSEGVSLEIEINGKRWGWLFGRGKTPEIEVHAVVPPFYNLDLDTSSGNITAEGISGKIRLDTGSGDVTGNELNGDVSADTGSGDVRLTAIRGSAQADTGSGDVSVDALEGDFDADTGSGDVRVQGAVTQFQIDTGSGDISVITSSAELRDSSADAGSGDIEIAVPIMANLSFKAKTGSGDFHLGFPTASQSSITKNKASVTINSGGPSIISNTGSGNITIRPANSPPGSP